MAADPADLVFNPGVSLQVSCTIRRKDRPVTTLELTDDNRDLLRWLLTVMDVAVPEHAELDVEVDDKVFAAAAEAGVFVSPAEVPEPVVPYRCAPEPETLALVTEPRAASSQLVLNPQCYLQGESGVPAAIRERVLLGSELWAHFDDEFVPRGPRAFADAPRLWVVQPDHGTIEPIWVPSALDAEIAGVIEGRRSVESLSPDARDALVLCNALIAPGAVPRDLEDERAQLRDQGYVVIRRALSPLTAAAVRGHFRVLRNAGYFEIDVDQVIGMRDGMYCEVACLFLQHQFGRRLERLLPEPVRGSYTWVRRYYPGAVLTRHRDRSQCRWNVSLCADLGPVHDLSPWPFYLEVGGRTHEVLLEIGDAVVYSGTEIPHWREALPAGREATMCFFHYVPTTFTGSLR